jgi:YebC/PmpR family DNA-binding regulatory protein
MGRQWLHAKREVANLKKGQVVGKLVREIMVAAKSGGADPAGNARLFAALEKARRASVTRDVIDRAIKKGAGVGDDKLVLEHMVFEGYAPHKIGVIVEVFTDNINRTAPEMRLLFKKGQLGTAGSNKFLFDNVGIVEAHHPDAAIDIETAAIEAGANDFSALTHAENDDIPEGVTGARFIAERASTSAPCSTSTLAVSTWPMLTAQCSAVVFSSLRADDMAPCESISRTRSVSPRKAAVVRSSSDRTMFIVYGRCRPST